MDKVLYRNGSPLKIALIGGARTGKDTIAEYLGSVAGFKRLAFGDVMKIHLYNVFCDLTKETKPRKEMIEFAQACRSIDPDVWVKHLNRSLNYYKEQGYENFVITDVRQPNEIDYCRKNGFLLVKVDTKPANQVLRALQGGEVLDVDNPLDSLALSFSDYDLRIENNGSLLDLYAKIDKILEGVE